jgi:hypothetical protein
MKKLFSTLRNSEKIKGVNKMLITDIKHINNPNIPALYDRMFRAASGKMYRN